MGQEELLSIRSLIDELSSLEKMRFTGRLNLLSNKNGQFCGHFILSQGSIYGPFYKDFKESRSFGQLSYFFSLEDGLKTVSEPELVSKSDLSLKAISLCDIEREFNYYIPLAVKTSRYRPKASLRLLIDDEFIVGGNGICLDEFTLLKNLSLDPCVGKLLLPDKTPYEIDSLLIQLKLKGAFKAIKELK